MAKKNIVVESLRTPDLIKAIAAKTGVSQVQVKVVFGGVCEVLHDCALAGKRVNLFNFGKLDFAEVKGKREREGIINPATGERGNLPPTKPYTKAVFKISKGLKDEMKENTLGSPFKF
jgi:nucleoid DNA-binding protein